MTSTPSISSAVKTWYVNTGQAQNVASARLFCGSSCAQRLPVDPYGRCADPSTLVSHTDQAGCNDAQRIMQIETRNERFYVPTGLVLGGGYDTMGVRRNEQQGWVGNYKCQGSQVPGDYCTQVPQYGMCSSHSQPMKEHYETQHPCSVCQHKQ